MLKISLGLAPSVDAVEQAMRAERLGYERVWLYDSAPLYADTWVIAGLIATRTSADVGPSNWHASHGHPSRLRGW